MTGFLHTSLLFIYCIKKIALLKIFILINKYYHFSRGLDNISAEDSELFYD